MLYAFALSSNQRGSTHGDLLHELWDFCVAASSILKREEALGDMALAGIDCFDLTTVVTQQ